MSEINKIIEVQSEELYKKNMAKYKAYLIRMINNYTYDDKSSFDDYLNKVELDIYNQVDDTNKGKNYLPYLNLIIKNSISNYKKEKNRNKNKILNEAISIETIPGSGINYQDPEYIIYKEWSYNNFKDRIINKLTWEEELVFNLKIQNFTTDEISSITGYTKRKIYYKINNIRHKISKLMSN